MDQLLERPLRVRKLAFEDSFLNQSLRLWHQEVERGLDHTTTNRHFFLIMPTVGRTPQQLSLQQQRQASSVWLRRP